MKYILTLFFTCMTLSGQGQHFSAGIMSGTGFSDYHGNTRQGKWQFQTGTVSGIFLRYSVTPVFGFGTEINFTSQSYNYKTYNIGGPVYYDIMAFDMLNHRYVGYMASDSRWDINFYRIPLYVTLSTPTRLKLSVSAGVYVSFTGNSEYTGYIGYQTFDYRSDVAYPYYQQPSEVPEHDNGFIYGASLSYPVNANFSIYGMGRYFIGHREFFDIYPGRTGASELALGVAYNFGGKKIPVQSKAPDTTRSFVSITPWIGVGFSYAKGSVHPSSYSTKAGLSIGLQMEVKLNKTFSVLTGVSYERKGYGMKDSSSSLYLYIPSEWNYYADTKTDIDYAVIPLLLKLRTHAKNSIYFTMGPYVGMLLNARVTGTAVSESSWNYGYTKSETDVYDDIEGNVNHSELGWIWGAGFEMPLGNGNRVDLGIQYETGSKNIFDFEALADIPVIDKSIHNATLGVRLGFVFPIHSTK